MTRLILLLLFVICGVPSLDAQETESIRCITWNLQWFPGKKQGATPEAQEEHKAQVGKALKRLKPDILLLQEVRDWDNVESVLPDDLTLHVVSKVKDGNRISNQQLAIASKYPAWSSWYEQFARAPATPPRGFAFVALDTPAGVPMVYSVHLKSNRGIREQNIAKREESAVQLAKHIEEMRKTYPGAKVIVGGDFNQLEQPAYSNEQTIPILKRIGLKSCFEGVPFRDRVTWRGQRISARRF